MDSTKTSSSENLEIFGKYYFLENMSGVHTSSKYRGEYFQVVTLHTFVLMETSKLSSARVASIAQRCELLIKVDTHENN